MAETIAKWTFDEWSHLSPGSTLEKSIKGYKARIDSDQIPLTFVAVENGTVLGAASLVRQDHPDHPELTPWLASVYVCKEVRKRGIGKILCSQILKRATELGFKKCFLFTDKEETWYEKQGWKLINREEFRGIEISIMSFEL